MTFDWIRTLDWMSISTWIISVVSLIGTILNAQMKKEGFYIWLVTNLAWVVIDCWFGLYAQAALFFVYAIMAVRGLVVWSKKQKEMEKLSSQKSEKEEATENN